MKIEDKEDDWNPNPSNQETILNKTVINFKSTSLFITN